MPVDQLEIVLRSGDAEAEDTAYASLLEDLTELGDDVRAEIREGPQGHPHSGRVAKGDPITIASIILTMVGAGGALTVALGRGGILSRLAGVLHEYVSRNVVVSIRKADGEEIDLSGPPESVERILESVLGR